MKIATYKPIGMLIRELRQAQGLTQVQLAELVGTSQGIVSDLERGRAMPLWSTACRFLALLGLDLPGIISGKISEKSRK